MNKKLKPVRLNFMWIAFLLVGVSMFFISMNSNEENPIIIIICSIIFFLVGCIGIYNNIKRVNEINNLIKNGRKIYSKIVSIEEDYSTTVNGNHPFMVVCQLEDNKGFLYEGKSESYMTLPINLEEKFVAVYIDNDDYYKYYIDVNDIREY